MDRGKQLLVALVVFVVALLGNRYYIESQVEQYRDKKYVNVVRAKNGVDAGALLTASAIESVKVPEVYAPKARIRWEDREQFLQQPLATRIVAGDYILETSFSSRGVVGRTLSQQLEGEDFRALTIPVDETNSFSRSIVSGDRVDILFTFTAPPLRQKITTILLQNVPIISTGSYSPAQQELGDRSSGRARYNTITLRLSAQDSLRLSYARQMGSIQLLLRSVRDSKTLELAPISSVVELLSATDKSKVEEMIRQGADSLKLTAERTEDAIREQAKVAIEQQKKQLNQIQQGLK